MDASLPAPPFLPAPSTSAKRRSAAVSAAAPLPPGPVGGPALLPEAIAARSHGTVDA